MHAHERAACVEHAAHSAGHINIVLRIGRHREHSARRKPWSVPREKERVSERNVAGTVVQVQTGRWHCLLQGRNGERRLFEK